MDDWTPWHIIALVAVLVPILIAAPCIVIWCLTARRRSLLDALGPDARLARLFGEMIAQCDGAIPIETVDELAGYFAEATTERKQAIIAAMSGLIDCASDGPANINDLPGRLLALVRRLSEATNVSVP